MANRERTFTFRVTASGVDELRRDLAALGPAGEAAFKKVQDASPQLANALQRARNEVDKTKQSMGELGKASQALGQEFQQGLVATAGRLGPLSGALTAVGGGAAVAAGATVALGSAIQGLAAASDSYNLLQARIQLVTGSAAAARETMRQLFAVAQGSGSAFEETVGSFQRLSLAAKDIGASTADVVRLSDAVQKLGRLGGASGSELQAGMQQFAQSLASGRLQGDELRSILENMPLLARAIAEGLGVGVGQLKEMGAEGKLTSEKVFAAILKQVEDIDRKFAGLPQTAEQATQRLKNDFMGFIADVGRATRADKFWQWYLDDYVGGALRAVRRPFQDQTPDQLLAEVRAEIAGTPAWMTRGVGGSLTRARDRESALVGQIGDDAMVATLQAAERANDLADKQTAKTKELKAAVDEVTASYRQQVEIRKQGDLAADVAAAREKAITDVLKGAGLKTLEDVNTLTQERADLVLVAASAAADEAEKKIRLVAAEKAAKEAATERAKVAKELAKAEADLAAQQDKDRLAAQKRGAEIIQQDDKRRQALAEYIAGLELQADAEALTSTEKKVQLALAEAQSKLVDEHGRKLRDLTELERQRVTQAVRLKDAHEEQRKAAEKAAEELARQIEKGTDRGVEKAADLLYDAFEGKITDIGDLLRKTLHRALAEAGAELLRAPIQQVVGWGVRGFGGAGGVPGVSGDPSGAVGIGGGGGPLSSLGDWFSGGASTIAGWFGAGAGGGSAAATQAMAAQYGISPGQAATLANGGGVSGGFSFGGVLGGAGIGYGIGSLIGRGRSDVGGALGGAAGSFFGPIGSLVGSVAGSVIGSLFGPKKSVGPNSNAQLQIVDGRAQPGLAGADNGGSIAQTVDAMRQGTDAINKALDAYGLSFVNQNTAYGGRYGFDSGLGGGATTPEQLFLNILKSDIIKAENDNVARALKGSKATSAEDLTADLDFALNFDSAVTAMKSGVLDFANSAAVAATREVANATTAVEEFRRKAKELGLDTVAAADATKQATLAFLGLTDAVDQQSPMQVALAALEAKSKAAGDLLKAVGEDAARAAEVLSKGQEKLKQGVEQSAADRLLALTDPLQLALRQLDEARQAELKDAALVGASTADIEAYYGRKRVELVEQANAAILQSQQQLVTDIKDFLAQQQFGETSTLTDAQKFAAAQSQWAEVLAAAQGSDPAAKASAQTRAVAAAQMLLSLGQDYLGGATGDYAMLEQLVRQQLARLAGLPGFNHGGSFTVGPNNMGFGGVDATLVQFRANPGEQVYVQPAGAAAAPYGGPARDDLRQSTAAIVASVNSLAAMIKQQREQDRIAELGQRFG